MHRPLEKIKKSFFSTRFFFFWHRPHSFFNLLELKNERLERKIFSICCVVIQAKWPFRYERPLHLSVKREGFFPLKKKEGRRKCTRKKVETFIIFLMAKHRFSRRFMKGPFRELSTITNEFFFLRTV